MGCWAQQATVRSVERDTGRPRMALGPGVPDPPPVMSHDAASTLHPRLREGSVVCARSILGGLHHEYFWAPAGAH
jgi:hypothetical protein